MIKEIELSGNKTFITEHTPPVTVELWDKDKLVSMFLNKTHVVCHLHYKHYYRKVTTLVSFKPPLF